MMLSLTDILKWLKLDLSIPVCPLTGIAIDTRVLNGGNLFVALKGDGDVDGHDYVQQAFEMGACAALVSTHYFNTENVGNSDRLIPVPNPLIALQALAYQRRIEFKGPVIAITGSNGKTTTKEMVSTVLSEKYRVHKTEGNLNNHIGVPITILECPDNADCMVLEMGMNHPSEIKRLCEIAKPTYGVITNVGRGHMGFFKSVEEIGKAKVELLESLGDSGMAFINGDDSILKDYQNVVKNTVLFGFHEECHLQAEKITGSSDRPAMRVNGYDIQLNVPGEHQLTNALAAVAVGNALEIPVEQMAQALAAFQSCHQRMEKMETGGIQILNDVYNANPDSMIAALQTLSGLSAKRHIAILGDMRELGEFSGEEHSKLGTLIRTLSIDTFWGVGDEMTNAVESANRNGTMRGTAYSSTADVLSKLAALLQPGDAVLVKGSRGMRMETVVEEILKQHESGE